MYGLLEGFEIFVYNEKIILTACNFSGKKQIKVVDTLNEGIRFSEFK
jgi:hypothetical protein